MDCVLCFSMLLSMTIPILVNRFCCLSPFIKGYLSHNCVLNIDSFTPCFIPTINLKHKHFSPFGLIFQFFFVNISVDFIPFLFIHNYQNGYLYNFFHFQFIPKVITNHAFDPNTKMTLFF
jgi:hypothetical protein